MADNQAYNLTFQDDSGKTITKTIMGPAGASEDELQQVVRQYLAGIAPAAAERRTVLKEAILPIPTKEEAASQVAKTEAQTAAEKKAMDERGILEAFSEGFMAPRKEDPFGLQVDPSIRKYLPVLAAANLAREGLQSGFYGATEALGQGIYNVGGKQFVRQRLTFQAWSASRLHSA